MGIDKMIREMNQSDYDEVYTLWKKIKGFAIRSVDDSRSGIERFLKRNPHTSVVACLDGKIVGNASITYIDDKIKLRHRAEFGIAILKEAWNLGIGSAILKEMIDLAREMDYERIELEVDDTNTRGIALYHKILQYY